MKRSGKWYRNNEKDVMQRLGLKPTVNSGSGWIEKEDGQSEDIICQLKSTDANSIKINKQDLDILQYNAQTVHKLPVFAIQFIKSDEVYLVIKPELLKDISDYILSGELPDHLSFDLGIDLKSADEITIDNRKSIKSACGAREQYREETENKYKKKKRSAR